MVNAATSEAERRIDLVERFAERLRTEWREEAERRQRAEDAERLLRGEDAEPVEHCDVVETIEVNYFAAEIPEDARRFELEHCWPDGTPCVSYSWFTGAPPE